MTSGNMERLFQSVKNHGCGSFWYAVCRGLAEYMGYEPTSSVTRDLVERMQGKRRTKVRKVYRQT